jgi:peptidoglycan-associated lipoprotein
LLIETKKESNMDSFIQWPLAVLSTALICVGCSSNNKLVKKTSEEKPTQAAAAPAATLNNGESSESQNNHILKTVYFAYDKANLSHEALKALKKNVAWLKENPGIRVTTEGRCDDRGTEEYNIALGQRRAEAVKLYYVDAGIDASRLLTISYGKDKPVCTEENDACWAQNRQAGGVIEPLRTASK